MISYEPMEFDLGAEATAADLARVEMNYQSDSGAKELTAYFAVAGQSKYLRVSFPHVDIFRVIDEMHLPLEEHGIEKVGYVANHFAYKVQGSPFWAAQREVFEVALPGSTHYLFVTGGDCLDVITRDEPRFCWVDPNAE
jgi:hypothetical protein